MEGLLTYWLSWFVLPRSLEDGLNSYVFPLAILLAKGENLPLASLYLGSLYARLMCLGNVTRLMGRYDVVTHVDFSFLHMFIWEHFSEVPPKSITYLAVVMEEVASPDVTRRMNLSDAYKPRAWRWLNFK